MKKRFDPNSLEVNDFVKFKYDESIWVGRITKKKERSNSTVFYINCLIAPKSCTHKCNGFFTRDVGLYLFTNDNSFKDIEKITESTVFKELLTVKENSHYGIIK